MPPPDPVMNARFVLHTIENTVNLFCVSMTSTDLVNAGSYALSPNMLLTDRHKGVEKYCESE
jgi:hypothetical protein